jgi:hypothetical protein
MCNIVQICKEVLIYFSAVSKVMDKKPFTIFENEVDVYVCGKLV